MPKQIRGDFCYEGCNGGHLLCIRWGSDLPIKRKTSRGGEVLELENYATVTF